MKKVFTLLTLCLLSLSLFAQDVQVSGIVVDEKGEPIVGATIQVPGTTLGTISDYDGNFELTVPESAKTLTVSYIGMQTQEVPVKKNVRVVLHEASEVLQEVIAVAYGTATKGTFAGSATAVRADDIEKKSPSEITKALAGEVAGVQVVTTSGQPGSNASIRIRGIGSINGSTAPLYVVDGVPYDGDLSSIDPGDIASTTILKDATATSLYGSRGANGVILITTKQGTSGEEGKIEVSANYGANMHLLPLYDVISDPQEYVEMAWMGMYNSMKKSFASESRLIDAVNKTLFSAKGIADTYNLWDTPGAELIDGYTGKFYRGQFAPKLLPQYANMTSWEDAIFRTGQKAEANVKIHGGTDKTTYYTSFGYLKDEGYYIGSDFDRFTVRSNIQHQAKKWLKGSLNMAYAYSTLNNPGQGSNMNNGFAYVNEIPPVYPVYLYNADGTIQTDPKTGYYAFDYGMREGSGRGYGAGINPAGSLLYDKQNTVQHQLTTNAMLEVKFYKDLKFTANVGLQYLGALASELTNPYYGDAAGIGRIAKQQSNLLSLTASQLLEYNKTIGDHTIHALAGHETNFVRSQYMYGDMSNLANPESLEWGNAVKVTSMTSNTGEYAIDSYFANVQYTYDERYLLTANYRTDGSSKFAKGHRWGHFGSVGGAWLFTNESFMDATSEWLQNGKLRFSWGVLGNQDVPVNYFEDQWQIVYSGGEVGFVWVAKGNENLTWERTQTFDLGLEFSISKYLDAEIDYFYKLTDDMIFPHYTPTSMGYSAYYENGGSMMNQGVELQFNIHAVDTRNVKLDIMLNGSHYQNKILTLPDGMDVSGSLVPGHSLYEWRLPEYLGVDAESGQALYTAYYDSSLGGFGYNSASLLRDDERKGNNYISDVHVYLQKHPEAAEYIKMQPTTEGNYTGSNWVGKSAMPDFAGGFGFDLEVYGVTLSATCSYGIGGYGYDNTYAMLMHSEQAGKRNWHVDMRGAWNAMMTDAEKQAVADLGTAGIPRLSNGSDVFANTGSTRFLTNSSFLSLNNVRLGYNFPKKWIEKIKLNNLSVWVTADNLAVLSARKGYNPLVSFDGSSDSYQYTPLSTIMGGLKFQF